MTTATPQVLPRTESEARELLEQSVAVHAVLSIEELATVLWQLGTILDEDRSDLVAHRNYPQLQPCPLYFEPRRLDESTARLIGMDLALTLQGHFPTDCALKLIGIPDGGTPLAYGVREVYPSCELIQMVKVPGVGFHVSSSQAAPPGSKAMVVDNATSTGHTAEAAARAAREAELEMNRMFTFMERGEGGPERLWAMQPPVRLFSAIRLSSVVRPLSSQNLLRPETPKRLHGYQQAILIAQINELGGPVPEDKSLDSLRLAFSEALRLRPR